MHALRSAPLIVVLVLAGVFPATAEAQNSKARVVLYKERLAAQFDTVNCVKNVFKINPMLFFRGEIPLFYERAISPTVSLELGLGVTLRDYLALSLNSDDADDYGAGTEIVANPSYHIAVRYYFLDDLEPQGLYLQTGLSHLVYTKDILVQDDLGNYSDEKYRDERVYNDLRLLLGYQMLSANSNWLFDLYSGFAYRVRDMQVVTETTDPTTRETTYTTEPRNDRVPAFFLGVKIGLGF